LFLYPYKIIATKPGCGLLEVVPNAMSRDQLGKKVEGTLMDYFIQTFGPVNSEAFHQARMNFIKSMAAYSVVCYILQIKDRHNGNILVDSDGHLAHIDFGFIFDSSPGGEFFGGFEVAPFKLSEEMMLIMGGRPEAEPFAMFMELAVKAFLAAREHTDSIIYLVSLMLDTNLPCFKINTLQNLTMRLVPDKTEKAAAKYFTDRIVDSFGKFQSFTTWAYDVFQQKTQGIEH